MTGYFVQMAYTCVKLERQRLEDKAAVLNFSLAYCLNDEPRVVLTKLIRS
jgi:hypothetical protein